MISKIEVRDSEIKGAGRGVFATAPIRKGETIEICPIIILPPKDFKHIKQTLLMNYIFAYSGRSTMLALGNGSLYNHKVVNNAKYELIEHEGKSEQSNELCIVALTAIKKGEEICINYGPVFDKMYKPR